MSADALWVLVSAALVFTMQAGFLCLEAGLTRAKNSINVACKNLTDFGICALLFWLAGFGMMFGKTGHGWFGVTDLMPDIGDGDAWTSVFFLFQVVFCGTSVTIISGAVAERMRFGGYLVMVVIVSLFIYPVFGHWAWGGALHGEDGGLGWLAQRGFVDFAGSTVVHSVGGWVSLAAVLVIGPRIGRFDPGARVTQGNNLPLALLGTMILWFGWIGFNGGSTLAFNEQVPRIVANTMLAAAAGLVAGMTLAWIVHRYPDVGAISNGALAGLVAITANCHAVTAADAIAIGAVGGVLCYACTRLLEKLKIDDVVGAVPVHLAAGVWGTMAVALFGDPARLGTGLTFIEQLKVQALGVGVCGLLAFGVTLPTLWVLHKVVKLRVSPEAERLGLNVAEHRATTDLLDLARTIETQVRTGDLSMRAPVQPFTEVGQIAERYNELMEVLQQNKADITELHQTEEKLREAMFAAEAASAAKSEFLANMSHEIRTPLHGILSFAGFGLKKHRAAERDKVERYFMQIEQSGRHLLHLVNDLLDLSKLEAGKMVFEFDRCDLGVVVNMVVDEFGSLLSEKRIKLKFNTDRKALFAEVDASRVMQVVRNLLNNAVKFSREDALIELSLHREADKAHLTVRDHGDGIPPNEVMAIFDKFVQSSKTRSGAGGTGLGLSICMEIVKGHGGTIYAENHHEGGAVFHVIIPLQRADAPGDVDFNVNLPAPEEKPAAADILKPSVAE